MTVHLNGTSQLYVGNSANNSFDELKNAKVTSVILKKSEEALT